MSDYTLVEAPKGATLDGPEGWMFTGAEEVTQAHATLVYGDPGMGSTARELAAWFPERKHARQYMAVVTPSQEPHHVVGLVTMDFGLVSNTHSVEFWVGTRPEHRGRGIGTMLADWAEAHAVAEGRTSWQPWVELPDLAGVPEDAPRLTAPDGGWVPADDPSVRFAVRRGYSLEEVERTSALDLPVAPALLDGLYDQALAKSDGYRLHVWDHDIPQEWREGYATLMTRFSTDAPSGGMDWQEELWDADRVTQMIERRARAGISQIHAAAEHLASGDLVGFTTLSWAGPDKPVNQDVTVVLKDHRGHRLGMLVKVANLRHLAEVRPSATRVYTWNASENEHMLAINVALGFRPVGVAAGFQKRV
jgi:GNAT superfamily N-acetyltransferase